MDNQLTLHTNILDLAIAAWLDSKSNRSGSRKTYIAYKKTIEAFRSALYGDPDKPIHLDLDSPTEVVALVAQQWAGADYKDKPILPATYNQRLAIVSSFYRFAKKRGFLSMENPIASLERRSVQGYARVAGLDLLTVKQKLGTIDRSTAAGKRDYTLLSIALNTGRRLSELAALTWGDLLVINNRVTITWRRCKGGKVMVDQLPVTISRSLLDYLKAAHGDKPLTPEQPIWIQFSRRCQGGAISIQAIADICYKYFETTKFHTLRHTFAKMMEDDGAKVSDIQAKLGHESLATTGRYLAALNKAENPHADSIANKLGIE